MHLLVPKQRSFATVKVKYKDYISQKMAVSGAFVFHKRILFFFFFLIATSTGMRESWPSAIMPYNSMLVALVCGIYFYHESWSCKAKVL